MMANYLKEELSKMWSFFKRPNSNRQAKTYKQKLISFFIIFVTDIILVTISSSLFFLLDSLGYSEVLKSNKILEVLVGFPLLFIGILTILIIPIAEEIIFRFHFKYRKWVINIIIPVLFASIFYVIFQLTNINASFYISIILGVILYLLINNKYPDTFKIIWEKKFHFIFYLSIFIFSFTHSINYKYSNSIILILPILIFPQFILGSLVGYLRIKLGFLWGAFLHILHNALFILPLILSLANEPSEFSVKNSNYSLDFKKKTFSYKETEQLMTSKDSLHIDNYSLKKIISVLLDKDINFIETNNSIKEKIKLEIKYKNHSGILRKKEVLKELEKTFRFSIGSHEKEILIRNVFVKDSLKFKKKSSENTKSSTFSNDKNSLSVLNGKISDLVIALNRLYKDEVLFTTDSEFKDYFSITTNKVSLEKLRFSLEKENGLSLGERKDTLKFVYIDFH